MRIYNTLGRKKQVFKPLRSGKAGMYVCGVTVYGECHLGHARCYVSFDIIKRYLEYKGFKVTHIQNFTDIDDKIINRAREFRDGERKKGKELTLREATEIISEKYTGDYFLSMDRLGIKRADAYPKATEHIDEMIGVIQKLLEEGAAYRTGSGVYFSIEKFKDYGKLSGRDLSGMRAGARVQSEEDKKHPLDFVLWKSAREDEPSWESPFGRGRPGWHIECSAMSMKYLGETFDIHGGGADLVFPHNENEIAQSEALTGNPFCRYWVHNGFVTIEKDKMSKSLGNFYTVREILEKHSPEAVRLFFLSAHYRSPIDFSEAGLEEAEQRYRRLAECDKKIASSGLIDKKSKETSPVSKKFLEDFENQMDNDFNTPGALAAVFDLARHINSMPGPGSTDEEAADAAEKFILMREVLGLPVKLEKPGFMSKKDCSEASVMEPARARGLMDLKENLTDGQIKELLIHREALRMNKKWKEADTIRDRLEEFLNIKDTREGVSWERR